MVIAAPRLAITKELEEFLESHQRSARKKTGTQ
jgi:hypothetical protein